MRILIVDDFDLARQMVQRAIQDLGRTQDEILIAANGNQALSIIAENFGAQKPIDLIFLDFWIPGKNGLEVLEALKTNPDWASAKVIMISGETDMETIKKAKELGAELYLPKPINKDHIGKVLKKYLKP